MNGGTPKSFDVPLHFLGSGNWIAHPVGDVANRPAAVHVGQQEFDSAGIIHLALKPGGGYVADFTRE
jgi:hypothetical protein